MRKHYNLILLGAAVFSIFNSCNPKNNAKSKGGVALGLVLEDKSKISRIPEADVPFGGNELPESFDMSDKMPEVGNQGGQQSCVAWAIAYAMKGYEENVQLGEPIKFSPAFVYDQINGGKNVPTQVTDGLNVLSQQGVCLMDEMPYDENKWDDEPSTEARKSAKRFRIDEWRRINTLDIKEVKTYLAAGSPVIIGAMVTADFRDKGFSEKENYIWNEEGETIGGHCMLVVGYDDKKNAFKIINSWGKEWGDQGYGWIDYKIFPDVVVYGFVAKDGYTSQEVLADIKKGKRSNDDEVVKNDEDPVKDNTDYKQVKNEDSKYNNETDNTTDKSALVAIHKDTVLYNVQNPDKDHPGLAMRIQGTLDIPARYGKMFYVIVNVFDKNTDKPVGSLIYPDYSNVNHNLAGYTQPYQLDNERMKARWWLHIPYNAFHLPTGKYDLYAIPTLFIDNFGVKDGERIDFWFQQP